MQITDSQASLGRAFKQIEDAIAIGREFEALKAIEMAPSVLTVVSRHVDVKAPMPPDDLALPEQNRATTYEMLLRTGMSHASYVATRAHPDRTAMLSDIFGAYSAHYRAHAAAQGAYAQDSCLSAFSGTIASLYVKERGELLCRNLPFPAAVDQVLDFPCDLGAAFAALSDEQKLAALHLDISAMDIDEDGVNQWLGRLDRAYELGMPPIKFSTEMLVRLLSGSVNEEDCISIINRAHLVSALLEHEENIVDFDVCAPQVLAWLELNAPFASSALDQVRATVFDRQAAAARALAATGDLKPTRRAARATI